MRTALLVAALILAISSLASGQDTLLINYQGRLTDDVGSPITGTPSMTFTIYNSQGIAQWSEVHPTVDVNEGLFNVTLGSEEALPDDVFTGEDRFLGIVVGTDPELLPRTLFTSVPSAAFAKRIAGDIATDEGMLVLKDLSGDSAIVLSSNSILGQTSMRMIHPPEGPSAEIIADGPANTIDFRLVHPPELTAVEIHSDGVLGQTSMKMIHPPEAPGAILTSDAISSKVTFKLVHPPELPIISLTGGADDGASIYMFNPQPEPPGTNPLLTLNTGADNGASIRMFNPQPEPPAVLFNLSTTPTTGASMSFFNDIGEVMGVEPTPFNDGYSIKLFNPQSEPPAVLYELASGVTTGASMSFFDDAGEVMGVEPSPFNTGFTIQLLDPQREPAATLAELASMYTVDSSRGRVAVYDPGASLESELLPGNLRLQFCTLGTDGPALVLDADQATARIGIGTDAPGVSLDMKSFGTGDGIIVNSSDGSQLFRVRENSDGSCQTMISDLMGTTTVMLRSNGDSYFTGGDIGIGCTVPNYTLDVRGTIGNNTTLYHSDKRWKQDIVPLNDALESVTRLRGVSYQWRRDEYPDMNFPAGRQIGLIAQEVESVVPEVVHTADDGYKSIDYAKLVAMMAEAIKELKQENEELKKRLEVLETR